MVITWCEVSDYLRLRPFAISVWNLVYSSIKFLIVCALSTGVSSPLNTYGPGMAWFADPEAPPPPFLKFSNLFSSFLLQTKHTFIFFSQHGERGESRENFNQFQW
uniref:Uncharacterized protein n=1 Tax=Physcomitrium patens TaxID=3218 RepID=A0A2K1IVZ5_PHYPA|nr:hypothetical protein PHYPA_025396 [Physcomitrium patens]